MLRRLNDQGLYANTTLLGEGVLEPGQTDRVMDAYRAIIDRIADEALRANVALKLTHLGLEIDEELAYGNVARSSSTRRRAAASSASTWSIAIRGGNAGLSGVSAAKRSTKLGTVL